MLELSPKLPLPALEGIPVPTLSISVENLWILGKQDAAFKKDVVKDLRAVTSLVVSRAG